MEMRRLCMTVRSNSALSYFVFVFYRGCGFCTFVWVFIIHLRHFLQGFMQFLVMLPLYPSSLSTSRTVPPFPKSSLHPRLPYIGRHFPVYARAVRRPYPTSAFEHLFSPPSDHLPQHLWATASAAPPVIVHSLLIRFIHILTALRSQCLFLNTGQPLLADHQCSLSVSVLRVTY